MFLRQYHNRAVRYLVWASESRLNAAFLRWRYRNPAALFKPKSDILMHKRKSDALSGKDRNNHHYIETYAGREQLKS